MPILTPEHSTEIYKKIILMGDSGTGKTGSLVSLALAGYNIKVIDFDCQAEEVVRGVLKELHHAKKNPISLEAHNKALSQFDIAKFSDKITIVGTKIKVVAALAWVAAMKQLNAWVRGGIDEKTVLVIDSLTFAAKAATYNYLSLSNLLAKQDGPEWTDYNSIQEAIAGLLALLYSPTISCNVIVNAHIDLVELRADFGKKDNKGKPVLEVVDTKALPKSIGKALASSIPAYFNTALVCKSFGPEQARKRFIYTCPVGLADTKTPYLGLPDKLPIESGMATFFAATI